MDSNQSASQASGSQQFPPDARSVARFHLQAAGHDGAIDTSLDHRNVYKPTTQEEIQFYENINDSDFLIEHPGLVKIKPFIPAYKGCVDRSSYTRSDDSMQTEGEEEVPVYGEGGEVVGYKENIAKKHTHSIVLSNLLYGLQNPTVADFKLGKRWWGSESRQAKRFRHDKSCAATTSSATGILFAGAHTWVPGQETCVPTTKSYGYSLREETLSDSMACVFPSVTDLHLPSEKPYLASETDPSSCLQRKKSSDYMADMSNRALKSLESVTDIRTATKESGWSYPGSSLLIAHGVSKFTGKTEVKCALIDFAHAHKHNDELPPDGVDDGLETLSKLLEDRANYLESYRRTTARRHDTAEL
ncbi:inositol/phosphatidylinositol kinase [Cryptococcus neoformans Bt1]|nr:inositol/phosphatidylinositol kinase [Cryptococcus neoformans var. grubii Bt1]